MARADRGTHRAVATMWPTVGLLTLGVVIGTFVGAPVLRRLPDATFRRLLAGLLLVLGVALVTGVGR